MIYVNSETILNNDRFFSLFSGELSTGNDEIIFQLPKMVYKKRNQKICGN